jgi:hypothetical protein
MLLALAFGAVGFHLGYLIGEFHDWKYVVFHDDIVRTTLFHYAQISAWNPYYCGGIPGIANLQSMTLSPMIPLRLIFGVTVGQVLTMWLMLVIGMEGLYLYARRHGGGGLGGLFAAITGACGGFFVIVYKNGHLTWWCYLLIPWALLAFEEGIAKPRWLLLGGAMVAWMLMDGGANCVPHTALALALVWCVETYSRLRLYGWRNTIWLRPTTALLLMALICIGISAIKLLPAMAIIFELPRVWLSKNINPLSGLLSGLFAAQGEYYIGWFVILWAGIALVVWDRKGLRAFFLFAAITLFCMGSFAWWSPWSLLQNLPFYRDLRHPQRMMVIAGFFACIGAARGIALLEWWSIQSAKRFAAYLRSARHKSWSAYSAVGGMALLALLLVSTGVFVGYSAYHVLVHNRNRLTHTFQEPRPILIAQAFRQSRGNRWDAHYFSAANIGTLQCFEETPFRMSPLLRADLAQEEYPADPNIASVKRLFWSPHSIALKVKANQPTLILVNQNWNRAWRSDVGQVINHQGLLAIQVPQGTHRLNLHFRDSLLLIGFWISLASWLFWLWFLFFRKQR